MRHLVRSAAALVLLASVIGCSETDRLSAIEASGELVIVTRNSPTTYYQNKRGPAGFEYDLAAKVAAALKVDLRVVQAHSLAELFAALERNEADLAAAGLTLTAARGDRFAHTDAYATLMPQVIYKAGKKRPRRLQDLTNMRVVSLAGSSHSDALAALRAGGYPELTWREVEGADSMALLELLDDDEADAALLDSNEFRAQQSLYPRLKVGFDLGDEQQVVWYLAGGKGSEPLARAINAEFQRLGDSGELALLEDQHFGHSDSMNRIGSHTFTLNMRRTLPEYEGMIRQVAAEYQLDWQLLAAIAYQESHWDPSAQSPTGVEGMMMLTLPTARELGVADRTDPLQSLRGGARYLKTIKRRLPDDIYEPDRTYFALAAYNIGRGHLEDARVLTERGGDDPHLWQDVMNYLPLLQKSPHYLDTRYGYARGQEAVTYVQNIRHYNNILNWQELPSQQVSAPIIVKEQLPEQLRGLRLLGL